MAVPDSVAAAAEAAFEDWSITIVQSAQANAVPLKQTIERMLARDVPLEDILESVTSDLELNPQFGRWFKQVNQEAIETGVKRVNNDIAMETWGRPELLQWQSVGADGRRCPDCAERHGLIKTEDEWLKLGEPTWDGTRCGDNCRCKLVPVGRADDGPITRARRGRK